jgi:hypothetical protein
MNTTAKPMWRPPVGWFREHCIARDTESMYHALVEDNNRRIARGLPPFEPSYELARAIVSK